MSLFQRLVSAMLGVTPSCREVRENRGLSQDKHRNAPGLQKSRLKPNKVECIAN